MKSDLKSTPEQRRVLGTKQGQSMIEAMMNGTYDSSSPTKQTLVEAVNRHAQANGMPPVPPKKR